MRQNTNLATVLGTLAVAGGLPGLIWPQVPQPIYVTWMVLAFPIGWTVSQAILALLFYGVLTPLGLVFQCVGRDSLHRIHRPNLRTYWLPKGSPSDPRRYLKQF